MPRTSGRFIILVDNTQTEHSIPERENRHGWFLSRKRGNTKFFGYLRYPKCDGEKTGISLTSSVDAFFWYPRPCIWTQHLSGLESESLPSLESGESPERADFIEGNPFICSSDDSTHVLLLLARLLTGSRHPSPHVWELPLFIGLVEGRPDCSRLYFLKSEPLPQTVEERCTARSRYLVNNLRTSVT